jgi:hypothetical protein
MSILWIRQAYQRGGTSGFRNNRHTLEYLALETDPLTTIQTVESNISLHGDCPQIGGLHPYKPYYYCVDRDIYRDEDAPALWHIIADYETPRGAEFDQHKNEPDPFYRKPKISWYTTTIQEAAWRTVVDAGDGQPTNGKLVCNTAKCLFDPPVMRDITILCLRIVRNEPTWNPFTALHYTNALNSDAFYLDCAAQQAKMDSITAEQAWDNGVDYWEVTYEIHFREDGWLTQVLNVGFYEDQGTTKNALQPILDKNGERVSEPRPLTASGLAMELPGPGNDNWSPPFVTFKLNHVLPFGPLNLFQPAGA